MSENVNVTADATPSSTPAAATPAAPAAPAATFTPVHAVAQPATPTVATPQAPATSGAPAVEPSWLRGRLEETRAAAERRVAEAYAQREAQYQAQLAHVQRQLHTLVGATPPGDPEVDAVRNQFSQLYPGLSRIEERAEQLLGVLEQANDFQSQQNHYWQSYGRQTMNRLFEKASESYGQALSDGAKRQLHAAFTGYVSSSPELTARYTNDPTLVDEFWDNFTSSFVNPARRAVNASAEHRAAAPLPSNGPSGSPQLQQPQRPENIDQRAAQGWAAYQHALQNRG